MSSSFPNDPVHLKRDGMGPEIVTPVSCLFPTIVGSRNILRQQPRSYVSSSRPRDRRQEFHSREEVETIAENAKENKRQRKIGH